jgi:FAD/FMN-containing dehydrogenase
VFPSERHDLHTEMEYAVPAEAGPACFDEVRRLVLDEFADVGWPLEYRTLAADDVWLSPAFHRPTVTISVHHDPPPADDRALFHAAEAVFRRYDGRPHWGKVHFRSAGELAGLYPRWDDWWRVRDECDPGGVFLNDHLRTMRPR